mmetsp:Transcript_23550/g.47055  ORF Transcript_23550/g.47055 Transcript_23550/m.47055 type:complete len:280 (-) Transcript_23550:237-1076(-)
MKLDHSTVNRDLLVEAEPHAHLQLLLLFLIIRLLASLLAAREYEQASGRHHQAQGVADTLQRLQSSEFVERQAAGEGGERDGRPLVERHRHTCLCRTERRVEQRQLRGRRDAEPSQRDERQRRHTAFPSFHCLTDCERHKLQSELGESSTRSCSACAEHHVDRATEQPRTQAAAHAEDEEDERDSERRLDQRARGFSQRHLLGLVRREGGDRTNANECRGAANEVGRPDRLSLATAARRGEQAGKDDGEAGKGCDDREWQQREAHGVAHGLHNSKAQEA